MRTIEQKYWDAFAILSLFDHANKIRPIDGNLKIQKMGFIVEVKGQEKHLKSAHYTFFRYNNGPFSKFLAADIKRLKEMGFIGRESNQITKRGAFLIEFIHLNAEIKGLANDALSIVQDVAREFGKYTGPQLTTRVYQMTVPVIDHNNQLMKVRDIEHCVDIIDPVKDPNLREIPLFDVELIAHLKEEFGLPVDRVRTNNPYARHEATKRIEEALQAKIA